MVFVEYSSCTHATGSRDDQIAAPQNVLLKPFQVQLRKRHCARLDATVSSHVCRAKSRHVSVRHVVIAAESRAEALSSQMSPYPTSCGHSLISEPFQISEDIVPTNARPSAKHSSNSATSRGYFSANGFAIVAPASSAPT